MSTLSRSNSKLLLLAALVSLSAQAVVPPPPLKPVEMDDAKVRARPVASPVPAPAMAMPAQASMPEVSSQGATLKGPMTFEPGKPAVAMTPADETAITQKAANRPRISRTVRPKGTPLPGSATESIAKPASSPAVDPYADSPVYVVSDSHFNMFLFPARIKKLHIGASVPLIYDEEKKTGPVYLEGNRGVLLQFEKGARGVFDIVTELDNGQVLAFYVKPESRPGVSVKVRGLISTVTAESATNTNSPTPEAVKLLERFVQNKIPSEYQIDDPMPTVDFQRFLAISQVTYSNGLNRRVHILQLVAVRDQETRVDASQFYRKGVLAALIDGDRVARDKSPLLYVVEEFAE